MRQHEVLLGGPGRGLGVDPVRRDPGDLDQVGGHGGALCRGPLIALASGRDQHGIDPECEEAIALDGGTVQPPPEQRRDTAVEQDGTEDDDPRALATRAGTAGRGPWRRGRRDRRAPCAPAITPAVTPIPRLSGVPVPNRAPTAQGAISRASPPHPVERRPRRPLSQRDTATGADDHCESQGECTDDGEGARRRRGSPRPADAPGRADGDQEMLAWTAISRVNPVRSRRRSCRNEQQVGRTTTARRRSACPAHPALLTPFVARQGHPGICSRRLRTAQWRS